MGDSSRERGDESVGASTIVLEGRPETRTHARARRGRGRAGEAGPDWLQPPRANAWAGRSQARAQSRLCAPGRSSPGLSLGTERQGLNVGPGERSGFTGLAPITSRLFSEAWPTAGV